MSKTNLALAAAIPALFSIILIGAALPNKAGTPSSAGPEFTSDGQLKLPGNYREWVYLSSDYDTPADPAKMQKGGFPAFLNVFVNPAAYQAFLQTGKWPDKTMFVVEVREKQNTPFTFRIGRGIVHSQSTLTALVAHVKDPSRFPGNWAFFDFNGAKTAKRMPVTARCYGCHAAHGAEDTTFVQFYPTLLPIAKSKGTLSAAYKREIESTAAKSK